MLQRIQSVFLFIIVVLMAVYIFFPVWISTPDASGSFFRLYPFFLYTATLDAPDTGEVAYWPYMISGILAVVTILVALLEVFSYKNRMNQVKLGALNSLVIAGVLFTAVYFGNNGQLQWEQASPGHYSTGMFFPAIAIICNLIANRFIRKDEKLVKSMDRIR